MKRLLVGVSIAVVLSVTMIQASLGADTLNVPQSPWPVCSSSVTTYCVTSVTIQTSSGTPQTLTWVPSGTSPSGTTTTTTSTTSTTTTTVPSTTVAGTTAQSGYWTDASWSTSADAALGFSGVIVDAGAANAFTNDMFFQVQPVIVNATTNVPYIADQPGSNYPASLNPSDTITVALETGAAQTGVSEAIGKNMTITPGTDANGTTLTFSGNPVPVAIASNANQCVDETGVAAADADQLEVFVAVTNDPSSGFGVDGVSGKMFVESNGACALSTPVWDATNQTLEWVVAAPHFLADGSTVNTGYYSASIPESDAALLWGLTQPNLAVSALTVSVTSSGSSSNVAESSISIQNGNIIVSATGFNFSSPKFTLKKNPKYKGTAFDKKTTITCVKAKSVRHVAGYAPKCPKGFKKKA